MAIGIDKMAIGLDKTAIGLDKMAIGIDKIFLPADKFFIRGHMNLAIRGQIWEIWPLGCRSAKTLDTSKSLPFRPPDKSVPALQSFPYKARRARDEIVEAVACAMAPNARDEIAEAAP